jgi:predicted GIY-YIG superfamily endonuclease
MANKASTGLAEPRSTARRTAPTVDWVDWRKKVTHNPPVLRLDGTVAYMEGWALLVPAEIGVYFIHDLRGFLYIGRTRNLNLRYRQHYWASHNTALVAALKAPVGQVEFSWITCEESVAHGLERSYVRAFQPLTNNIRFSSTDPQTH